MVDIKSVLNAVKQKLQEADISNSDFEAKQLLMHFNKISQADILLNSKSLSEESLLALNTAVKKRCENYPLQYILGEWEFFGLDFKVGEGVLIPRQDTEVLCQTVLDFIGNKENLNIIDLCSGSGCIAITLDKMTKCKNNVFALEKSPQAIPFLKENININKSKASLVQADVLSDCTLQKDFDIIVSNPPYLNDMDMMNLQTEVSFEPKMALYAEDNGLYFYENITKIWTPVLKKGGLLAYEIGINQENDVMNILKHHNYCNIQTHKDLCGITRVVCGIKN